MRIERGSGAERCCFCGETIPAGAIRAVTAVSMTFRRCHPECLRIKKARHDGERAAAQRPAAPKS